MLHILYHVFPVWTCRKNKFKTNDVETGKIFLSICQAELVNTAVKGKLNVLKPCVKFPTVKREVMTSSRATVMMSGKPLTSDVVVDETWYSDPLVCEKYKVCMNVPILIIFFRC